MNCSGDDIFVYKNYRPMYCLNCGQALDWSDNGIFRIEKDICMQVRERLWDLKTKGVFIH